MRPTAALLLLLLLASSAPPLALAQTRLEPFSSSRVRDFDPYGASVVVVQSRNVPGARPSIANANAATQPLVYAEPGGFGGGGMTSVRAQTALGGVSNVNTNKKFVYYSNPAGRVYPAARARTALSGPQDFGGSRTINIRGTIRSSGGQVDNIQWMGPTTITSTWYARSSAASGAWPFTTRRGINTLAQTDPSFTVGTVPIRNIATLYTNSAIGVMGSGRRAANALSGNSNGFGVQSRTRKASALAMAGGPGGGR